MSEPCRLYLVTPPAIDGLDSFASLFAEALAAGDVAAIQLRLKSKEGVSPPDEEILRVAARLIPIARARAVEFLINDRPDLAEKAGADGVHLGLSDMGVREARAFLGDMMTIGATCHNSRHLALIAGEAGADYVAFGAFYPTATKEAPTRAEPDILDWWRYATAIPSIAIGGVTVENCAPLVKAGADFIAVSSAVWNCGEGPAAAVRAFNEKIAETLAA